MVPRPAVERLLEHGGMKTAPNMEGHFLSIDIAYFFSVLKYLFDHLVAHRHQVLDLHVIDTIRHQVLDLHVIDTIHRESDKRNGVANRIFAVISSQFIENLVDNSSDSTSLSKTWLIIPLIVGTKYTSKLRLR